MAIDRQILLKRSILIVSILLIGVLAWRVTDPTCKACLTSDSGDGRYRCAIFHIEPCYRFAIFEKGWWHWKELPGERGELYTDSLDLCDVQYHWSDKEVLVTGRPGTPDDIVRATGRIVQGKQVWDIVKSQVPPTTQIAK